MEQSCGISQRFREANLGYVQHGVKLCGSESKEVQEFVVEGIRQGYDTPWEEVKGQAVLGEENFVERIKARLQKAGSKREQPGVRRLEAMEPGAVLKKVAQYFDLVESQLTGKRTGHRDERAIALELMYRYGGAGQANWRIGRIGLHGSKSGEKATT